MRPDRPDQIVLGLAFIGRSGHGEAGEHAPHSSLERGGVNVSPVVQARDRTNDAWPRGEFNLPRPLFTEKAFPEDEIVVTTAVGAGSPGTVEAEFLYEKRFGPTGMLEIAL